MLPLRYEEPVYRPPSEAESLILQVTLGCSWNRCAFCEMYTGKRFRPRPEAEVLAEIRAVGARLGPVRRVFLADGDAFVLSTRRLLAILEAIRTHIGGVQRVSAYAMPRQILRRPREELAALREAGLRLLYVGVESGDDEVLARIRKGETRDSTIQGLRRAREAGIAVSVMIINGLAGRALSQRHAVASAEVLNAVQPEYAAVLTLMHPLGDARFRAAFGPGYEPLDLMGSLREMETLIAHTALERTIFRSDHASNRLVLKGVLGRDRERLLAEVRLAMARPQALLRPEWTRAL
ncbi:B12-binding domain-containing radical SAM protein [Inmirania thermothiophila]|nr:radical SAM protein [Inmirania thermothiophila]